MQKTDMTQNLRKWFLLALLACISIGMQAQGSTRYHTVEEGQTLYSIARLYNLSPAELMKLNPEVGDLIQPGDKLRIPDNATKAQIATGPGAQFVGGATSTPQPGKSTCKEMYQIKKKDTMYRIALEHNISVQELIAANPGLTEEGKLKKGEWLCIPFTKAELQVAHEREAAEKAAAQAAAEAAAKKTHKSHLNVAVVLPLKENTDRGGKMIEFYQGLLMAVDSVRKQGVSVDIYAYHSGNGLSELNDILMKDEMKHMDVIFGPLDGVQANTLSNFCQQNKIRLVMPFATTNTYASNNPYAYVVTPQGEMLTRNGATLMASHFANSTFIIAQAGETDTRAGSFISQLNQQLSPRGITPKQLSMDADDMTIASTLSAFRNNLIVLNNVSSTAVQKATKRLRAFLKIHTDYKVQLMAYPEWSTYQGAILQDFHALDTYGFAAFFRNGNDSRTQSFENRFKGNFHHEMFKVLPRYGILGMDLGYYFLHGLATLGDYFDEKQNTLTYRPLQNAFNFSQAGSGKAKINTKINLIHYAPSGVIEVTR